MTKLITSLIVVLLGTNFNYSQVGIGTETPQAMLDVAGTVLIQGETTLQEPLKLEYIEGETVTELTGNEILLVSDLGDENIVKQINLQTLAEGLNIPNENTPNTSLYKVRASSNFTLLNVGINLGTLNSWQRINFPASATQIGNSSLIDSNGAYTVPSSGFYSLNMYFRYGTGVQLSLLSGVPQVGIVKRESGTSTDTLLDSRSFTGLNLGIANVTFTEAEINTIYQFNAGDKIYFALNSGGVSLNLLSTSFASFNIYKVAGPPQ